ncbi:MAG: hypothetical protein N2Z72_05220 [Bacteroidales bacterium]|nr:hypothetical protein [Bacteroidales bacterium]
MKRYILFILTLNFVLLRGQFYVFNGNIGNIPITMHILKTPIGFFGSYYYEKIKLPIMLVSWTTPQESSKKWKLYAKVGNQSEEFDGVFDGNIFSGTWKKNEKSLPFSLKRNTATEQLYKTYHSYDSASYYKFSCSVVYPLSSHPNFSLIENYFFEYSIPSFLKQIEIKKAENFAQHKSDFSEFESISIPEDITMFYPIYSSTNFIVYAKYDYTNLGGARGYKSFSYSTLSLKLNTIIEASDILPIDHKALNQKLINELKKFYEDIEIVDDLPLSDATICMTDGGIMFNFPPGILSLYSDFSIYLSRNDAELLLNNFAKNLWTNE